MVSMNNDYVYCMYMLFEKKQKKHVKILILFFWNELR